MKYFFLALFVFAGYGALAQDDASLRKKQFNLDNGVALSGYDPVSYFTQNKPVKGNKDLAVVDNGVTYYFSSAADKEEFKKNPSKYEPQYGGWCAYAMGKDGSKVEIDPETFKIINGKLFVFYNKFFNNTLKSWNKDETKLHQQADANWSKVYR
ncbi:MAG: YHS domain protein [Bacteroidetes bacterium]|nr:YHS domain protein [Bacteroidota bacterium]